MWFMRICPKVLAALPVFFLFAATGAGVAQPLRVELERAELRPFVLELALSGTIEAWNSIDLGFRQGGRVVEVLVAEGDSVSPGQDLARLDPVQHDQALKVAQAGLNAALASEAQARQASDRAEEMLARGVGTRVARDDAHREFSAALGGVQQARTNLDLARRALEDTVLRAPSRAVVTRRDMAPGLVVGAAQAVLGLASVDGLEAVFNAPDHPLLQGAMGTRVRLDILDIDIPQLTGIVTEISPLVNARTGTVTVRARLDDIPEGVRLMGAAVRGHLLIRESSGIAVPWTALTRAGDAPAVWVVDQQGVAGLQPVEILYFSDDDVYLSKGVSAGQMVVGAGAQLLYPGRHVIPLKAEKG